MGYLMTGPVDLLDLFGCYWLQVASFIGSLLLFLLARAQQNRIAVQPWAGQVVPKS